jgi:hypothetical protein
MGAFLLELLALVLLAGWGATRGTSMVSALLLGVAAPAAAAVVWGLFASPRARIRLPVAGVLAVKALVFGAAMCALWALEGPRLAASFAAFAFANTLVAAFDRAARRG